MSVAPYSIPITSLVPPWGEGTESDNDSAVNSRTPRVGARREACQSLVVASHPRADSAAMAAAFARDVSARKIMALLKARPFEPGTRLVATPNRHNAGSKAEKHHG